MDLPRMRSLACVRRQNESLIGLNIMYAIYVMQVISAVIFFKK